MTEYRELEHAIAVMETQRDLLGNGVVDISIIALRQRLFALQTAVVGQQVQVTVLVADISGFTKMSEARDAELVRETINTVWQRLDQVIESWGGHVDKHVGDAVIALFGVPLAREDDAERAIQAALDMQMELALFNEQVHQGTGKTHFLLAGPRPELQMRIALHRGPVYFGPVGSAGESTAVGETVNIANQLEKMAPVEGVLVSEDVYQRVQTRFEVEPQDAVFLEGKSVPTHLFVIKRERARPFHVSIRGIAGIETRIVGRNSQLQQLQDIFQETNDLGLLRVVTIEGEPGVGKSRLLYEFERLLNLLPEQIALFRGRVHQEVGQTAYTLFHDLFANYFDIHHRNSPMVAREKLVRGIVNVLQDAPLDAPEHAHFIGQLLGFNFADSPYLQEQSLDVRQIRERAFQDIAGFFTAVAFTNSVAVLFLEDLHWADEGTFDLIDYLVQSCANAPIMLVCLARPTLQEKRPSWQLLETLKPDVYRRITLPTLTAIDSRHLAMEILQNLRESPMRLIDMIVTGAQGNPFYLEELISMLIETGVVTPEGSRWQLNLAELPEIHQPLSLAGLVTMRLERLSDLEHTVLQKAAVLGQVFWDTLLIYLIQADDDSVNSHEIMDALYELERKAWIYRRKTSTIAEVQEYAFRHDSLGDAIYQSSALPVRQRDHAQAATWFANHADRYARQHTPVVAYHFAQAGNPAAAAQWYAKAAAYAESTYMPETAIAYYQQALRLLPQDDETAVHQTTLNEGLATMLRNQARFSEAIAALQAMLAAARQRDEIAAQARALHGLLQVQGLRGDSLAVRETAVQMEKLAHQLRSPQHLAQAKLGRAWSHILLGQLAEAVPLAKEALRISTAASELTETAFSNALLGNVARLTKHPEEGTELLQRSLRQFRQANQRPWEALLLANLAHLAHTQDDLVTAVSFYNDSLQMARNMGDFYTLIISLRKLGRLAQADDMFDRAEQFFHEALVTAERSNQRRFQAMIANDLGFLYLARIAAIDPAVDVVSVELYIQQANTWLQKATTSGHYDEFPLILAWSMTGLADLRMIEGKTSAARQAVAQGLTAVTTAAKVQKERTLRRSHKKLYRMLSDMQAELANLPETTTLEL